MDYQPHVSVVTFEKLVLFPINICVFGGGLIYLFHRHWIFGVSLLLVSFLLGLVGQGLPHRKRQDGRQLLSGRFTYRFGAVSDGESLGLAKAMMKTAVICSFLVGVAAWRSQNRWYWTLADVVLCWIAFPIVSASICFTWSWFVERFVAHPKNT